MLLHLALRQAAADRVRGRTDRPRRDPARDAGSAAGPRERSAISRCPTRQPDTSVSPASTCRSTSIDRGDIASGQVEAGVEPLDPKKNRASAMCPIDVESGCTRHRISLVLAEHRAHRVGDLAQRGSCFDGSDHPRHQVVAAPRRLQRPQRARTTGPPRHAMAATRERDRSDAAPPRDRSPAGRSSIASSVVNSFTPTTIISRASTRCCAR